MVVFVFVLPAYEACVVKCVSLRMAQSLKPADSSAVLTMQVGVSQFGNLVFVQNKTCGCTMTACELWMKGLSWRSAPGVKVFGTGAAGPMYLETALDSSHLGTFVASALAALFSGCKPALGVPQAGWNFQCIVWRSFDWRGWTDTEELTAVMPQDILGGILLDENEGASVQSTPVSERAVLGAQDLVFVPCLDPSEYLALCVPSTAGSGLVDPHCYPALVGYA